MGAILAALSGSSSPARMLQRGLPLPAHLLLLHVLPLPLLWPRYPTGQGGRSMHQLMHSSPFVTHCPNSKISPPLCALLHCPAQLTVEGPDHPVTATVGQDVVLPCHLSPQRDARSLDVRWIRDHISETVHHYRNGEDLYREQMGAYAGRTELARDGLSAGSLDLRITGLRPSDDGRYVCTVEDADAYNEAIVDLEVSATGADPHLSLGGYEAGGVRVLCR
uniref:Ig-like domain-containing protein n=1 Tax=Cairina moschata TaxID=8855 RepID=A0A8C3CMN2_CAIMO